VNLLDLMIKVGLKDEASGKAEGVASRVVGTLGKAGATVAKAVGVGVAAVGAGVAAIGVASTQAYAAYEQNVGGIQKIFGNMGKSLDEYAALTGQTVEQCGGKWQQLEIAQTKALANADAAYKTCGQSANAYMEQVTGFSAALVSSLGGDTVKAVDYANMAMVDMSDNANTFGTATEDLQNAYQGFAKQNYTMLDNLKLGYGGTKEEMQRLVKDAHAVNSAVDESSLSFDNIVLAIHTMQEQMNIAGTTSREAATTIEGSVNMMKAAWENWLTELGKDDADMGKLTEELVESVETAASNVIPRVATIVGTALSQLPSLVTSVGPVLGQAFVDIFTQALDSAAEAVPGPMGGILSAVSDGVDEIGERFKGLGEIWSAGDNPLESLHLAMVYGLTLLEGDLSTLQENITSSLPGIAEGFADVGGEVVSRLAEGIEMGLSFLSETAASLMTSLGGYLSENLPSITESGLQILTGLSESIAENAGVLAEGAANLIVGLAQGIADSLPTIIEQAPVIVQNLASAINDNAPILLGAGIQAIVTLALGIVQAIPTLIANIPAIFSAFVSAWSALDWLSLGRNAITFLGNGITGMVGFVSTCGANIVSAIRGAIQNLPSTLSNLGKVAMYNLQGAISGTVGAVKGAALRIASNIESAFLSLPGRVVSIGRNIVQGIANGISGAAGVVVSKITGVVGGAIEAAKNLLGIHSPSRVFRKIFGYVMQGAALGIDDTADEPVKSMRSAVRNVEKAAVFGVSVTGGGAYGATASGAAGIAGGGNVYNLYLDGDLLGVDGRVASALRSFVAAVEQSMAMGVA
jgi:phage-related protein